MLVVLVLLLSLLWRNPLPFSHPPHRHTHPPIRSSAALSVPVTVKFLLVAPQKGTCSLHTSQSQIAFGSFPFRDYPIPLFRPNTPTHRANGGIKQCPNNPYLSIYLNSGGNPHLLAYISDYLFSVDSCPPMSHAKITHENVSVPPTTAPRRQTALTILPEKMSYHCSLASAIKKAQQ